MTPLNIWLTDAEATGDKEKLEHGVREYGNAIKDLVAANIFPGDMLYKNFGVTRQGRVVFYDYDEIEYISDCNFRTIPAPRNEEDEMASEPWYHVAKNDVFPEQFSVFLLGNPRVRECFMKYHADLLTADYWQQRTDRTVERPGRWLARADNPTRSRSSAARRAATARGVPAIICGTITFSSAENSGSRWWN